MLFSLKSITVNQRILIVGSYDKAIKFAYYLKKKYFRPEILFSSFEDNFEVPPNLFTEIYPVSKVSQIIEKNAVDQVFILSTNNSIHVLLLDLIDTCIEMGIVCHIPVSMEGYQENQQFQQKWNELSLRTIFTGRHFHNPCICYKHLFDVFISIVAIISLLPLFFIIALLIKLTSQGPVFFVHKRIGYNRHIFNMIKFRTMVKNAESMQAALEAFNEADGTAFKISHDPRITWFGKWLRKTSMDELPQLLNVIKGDMSLVGPRPLPTRDVNKFQQRWQHRRFSVLPGMTCYWQITRKYSMPFDEWAQLDLDYIDNWSFKLDIQLLIKTLPVIFKGNGI